MKKFISILLAGALTLSLCACGSSSTQSSESGEAEKESGGADIEGESSTEAESGGGTDVENESGSDETAKRKVGGVYASLAFDFQLQMSNGIERAAKEKGYEYVSYDYNLDAEAMLTGLETMEASDVGALYGLFLAPDSATDFMQSHPDIGVLTQGSSVPGCQAWTENDYTALANQFVESLDKYVTENNITEGTISALWLETCENEDGEYFAAKEEIKDVINQWCEGKDFSFNGEYYPKDDEEASNFTAQMMNADPSMRFIFAFNNGYAIAAANEIASAVSDTGEYFVFSSEGDEESFRLIADDSSPLRGCAYMDIEESGYQVGLQLINWIENGEMENVVVDKVLVDSDNIAEYQN